MILLSGAVVLGLVLGVDYLRRVRSRPVLIGLHLLLGAGGVELIAIVLRGTPDGKVMPAGWPGKFAALLLLMALFTGLLAPMVGRRSRNTMNLALATHVSLAAVGFTLLLAWLALSPA